MENNAGLSVLFVSWPAKGHLNPYLFLASGFKRGGYQVRIGTSQYYADYVKMRGYDFVELRLEALGNLRNNIASIRSVFSSLWNKRAIRNKLIWSLQQELNSIEQLKPDIIIWDAFYCLAIPLLNISSVNVIVNTNLPCRYGNGVPPLNSSYIPRGTFFNSARLELIWYFFFLKRLCRHIILGNVLLRGLSSISIARGLEERTDNRIDDLLDKNQFNFGIQHIHELSIVPSVFEFSSVKETKAFIGNTPMLSAYLEEQLTDPHYSRLRDKIVLLKGKKKILYCSLGTIGKQHSSYCVKFLIKLMRACNREDWVLVISTARSQDFPLLFSKIQSYKNIHLIHDLPQVDFLEHVDMMITHGGVNSVMECIYKKVPMVVYPLNDMYDQKGNAARVAYHHLGLRGNMKRDSIYRIRKCIEAVLSDNRFREALNTFHNRLSLEFDLNDFLRRIGKNG